MPTFQEPPPRTVATAGANVAGGFAPTATVAGIIYQALGRYCSPCLVMLLNSRNEGRMLKNDLPGPAALDSVHCGEVQRRFPVTSVCATLVPVRCRLVVRRRYAHPLVETKPEVQGLTLVHFSAQRKHSLWDTLGTFSIYAGHSSSQTGHKTAH